MKYSEIKKDYPGFDKVASQYINDAYKQFYENHLKCSERVWRFLFTTNAGGAIAVLSFIGSSNITISNLTILSICSYAIGIVMVGILMALTYHRALNVLVLWNKKTVKFYKNDIEWEGLTKSKETRMSKFVDFLIYTFAYGSFVCFILGLIFGGGALFSKPT